MSKSNCVFCDIVNGTGAGDVVGRSDNVIVFKDIHPASTIHILSCPTRHIDNLKSVQKSDLALMQEIKEQGVKALLEAGGQIDDAIIGFHWPILTFVKHLHLHIIWPASQMSWFRRQLYRPNSFYFATFNEAEKYIQDQTT